MKDTDNKCNICGRFISMADMESGDAKHIFEPDNHFGPEISEWVCDECNKSDKLV